MKEETDPRNSFLGMPDVNMDKSEAEIDEVVEELENLAGEESLSEKMIFCRRRTFATVCALGKLSWQWKCVCDSEGFGAKKLC